MRKWNTIRGMIKVFCVLSLYDSSVLWFSHYHIHYSQSEGPEFRIKGLGDRSPRNCLTRDMKSKKVNVFRLLFIETINTIILVFSPFHELGQGSFTIHGLFLQKLFLL